MSTTYDPRTPLLLSPFNTLLSRNYLPTISHPSELTPSLLIALYESLIHSRLSAIERKDKSSTAQIRNIKLLLGEMVMTGWDVGGIDPVGVVEREESCLMDLVEVFVEIGREVYGIVVSNVGELESGMRTRKELTTISERMDSNDDDDDDDDDSVSSTSTLRPIRRRADSILSRIHTLNPSLRPSSPTNTTISRATQTSPPHQFITPRPRRKHKPTKRTPQSFSRRKLEEPIQIDDDTESGIPSSIPLSYSSDSSSSTIHPPPRIPKSKLISPLRNPRTSHILAPISLRSPARSRTYSSSSESHFRVDSPYTAALRRRRQLAIESFRKSNRSLSKDHSRHKNHRIRVFSIGRDVADSTFAEDSDATPSKRVPPRSSIQRPKRRRSKLASDQESTTDALTDLEKRVKALRIWGRIEEERKQWLMNEINKQKENDMDLIFGGKGSDSDRASEHLRPVSQSSRLGSRGSIFDLAIDH
jgi:hypothetical protein